VGEQSVRVWIGCGEDVGVYTTSSVVWTWIAVMIYGRVAEGF
jgi:hypothetical protein